MNYGTKKCIWIALGDITANLIQATLVIFFIGSFIANNSETLNILKWFGVAYLFYLSYDIYKSRPTNFNKTSTKSKKLLSFFKDGFIVAGTSPKAWIFFPLIFPQFINFNENYIFPICNSYNYIHGIRFSFTNWLCNLSQKTFDMDQCLSLIHI